MDTCLDALLGVTGLFIQIQRELYNNSNDLSSIFSPPHPLRAKKSCCESVVLQHNEQDVNGGQKLLYSTTLHPHCTRLLHLLVQWQTWLFISGYVTTEVPHTRLANRMTISQPILGCLFRLPWNAPKKKSSEIFLTKMFHTSSRNKAVVLSTYPRKRKLHLKIIFTYNLISV